jgi:hypothetical protein
MDAIKKLVATCHGALTRKRPIRVRDKNLHTIVDAPVEAICDSYRDYDGEEAHDG